MSLKYIKIIMLYTYGQEAVDELSEQLHVEGVDEENEVRLADSTCC
jgi:hypothetical protein